MPLIGAVADDLTGATTTGVLLARSKARTAVFFNEEAALKGEGVDELDAILISSNSRPLPANEAYAKVKSATDALKRMGVKYFSKRIDTTLRGGVGVEIDAQGAAEIASRSRGTPRLANRLLKRVRDYAQVKREGSITWEVAAEALEFFEIDAMGLDTMDVRILDALCRTFRGRPVGLTTLASAISEDPSTLEDVYEPYLLQCGLIVRTPQGRQATLAAFDHLGAEPPAR